MRAANPRLEEFRILREGDEITLEFLIWTDNAKVPFRLIGSKHDYYRMAMGVSLDETAQVVVKADSSLTLTGTDKSKDSITLRLESKLAVPPPPKPAAPAAPSVSPEEQISREFMAAIESKNAKRLQEFAEKYPGSPWASKARAAVEREQETAAYTRALKDNTISSYQAFLGLFPNSPHRGEIEERLAVLTAENRAAEEKRLKEETAKQEASQRQAEKKAVEESFAAAKKAGTIQALSDFLAKYPKSDRAKEADALLRIARDDDAFDRSKGSAKGLSEYLADYPRGRHADEAEALLKDLKAAAEEEKTRAGAIRAVAADKPPAVDGKADDAAWKKAPVSRIPLAGPGADAVEVRAVHNGNRIYLLAQWRDRSQDVTYRPWIWDAAKKQYAQSEKVDDAFSVALFKGGAPSDACMLSGGAMDADIWLWRAFWGGLSGYASDQRIVASRDRLPKSNPFGDKAGRGQVWLQNVPDEGTPAWNFDVPLPDRTQQATVPSYISAKPSGSLADVQARGTWAGGMWTVEFSRAFDTGSGDDTPLVPKKSAVVAFAVYDHADKESHAHSGPVRLDIEGK